MGGWARRSLQVTPDGRALPCQAAATIPGLVFDSVRDRSLAWIWSHSEAFRAFRGEAWMKEPCRTCPERARDFGGCRCQALALTGDAAATDPTCDRSQNHVALRALARWESAAPAPPLIYRTS
jgi:pyrroloquinoline quinone biosynthesis protein E